MDMDHKYLTDSESLSLNIEATCLLHSSPRNFPYEIKMDKYRPYPSMISMFTSDSQHPPRSRRAVHLGVNSMHMLGNFSSFFVVCRYFSKLTFSKKLFQEHYQSVKRFGSAVLSGLIWVQTVLQRFAAND